MEERENNCKKDAARDWNWPKKKQLFTCRFGCLDSISRSNALTSTISFLPLLAGYLSVLLRWSDSDDTESVFTYAGPVEGNVFRLGADMSE